MDEENERLCKEDRGKLILQFCLEPRSKKDIADHISLKDLKHFEKTYLKPLLEANKLKMTIPDKPTSRNQKYETVK